MGVDRDGTVGLFRGRVGGALLACTKLFWCCHRLHLYHHVEQVKKGCLLLQAQCHLLAILLNDHYHNRFEKRPGRNASVIKTSVYFVFLLDRAFAQRIVKARESVGCFVSSIRRATQQKNVLKLMDHSFLKCK